MILILVIKLINYFEHIVINKRIIFLRKLIFVKTKKSDNIKNTRYLIKFNKITIIITSSNINDSWYWYWYWYPWIRLKPSSSWGRIGGQDPLLHRCRYIPMSRRYHYSKLKHVTANVCEVVVRHRPDTNGQSARVSTIAVLFYIKTYG